MCFEALEGFDFQPQLGNRTGGSSLIQHLFFSSLHLVVRGFVQVFHVVVIKGRHRRSKDWRSLPAPVQRLQLKQPTFKAFTASAQRLVDGLRGRGQPALQDGECEADGASTFVVFQCLRAVELLAHVFGHDLVEMALRVRQLERQCVGDALRKQRRAVELEQLFLHHAAHQVRHVGQVHAIPVAALETVSIQQCHEQLKVCLFAVVRSGRHQQEMACQGREQLPQSITLGVLGFAAKNRGRHLVGFVANHQVPAAIRSLQLLLYLFIAREFVQPGDDQVGLHEPVAGTRRFQLVIGQNLERQVKAPVQLVLPLLGQAAGAHDQAALQVTAGDQLLDQQPGHDGLAGTGVVRQQKTQRLAWQHGLVDGRDLVRQRVNHRGMDRQHRVKQVGKPDSLRFGYEAKQRAIAVEAPWPALLYQVEPGFGVAIQQLVRKLAGGCLVGQFKRLGAEPQHADNRYQTIRNDAAHRGVGL